MKAIHDLDGAGEVFTREIPDPVRPVAQHHTAFCPVEPASCRFAKHPLCERRISVACGSALDGSRIGDGALVPDRPSFLVPTFQRSTPCRASPPASLRSRRPACPCGRPARFAAQECLCRRLRGRALERSARQAQRALRSSSAICLPRASAVLSTCLAFTFTPASSESKQRPFFETDHCSSQSGHARDSGRQRRLLHQERPVARNEACVAGLAVVVGAYEGLSRPMP